MGIRRVVAVHRRIGRRADRDRSVGTVSQQDHRGGQQQRVPHHAAAAVGVPHAPPEQGEERQCEDGDARVDRQAERIDEQYVDHRPDVDRVGDNQSVDEPEDRQRDDRCDAESLEGHGRVFAEIVDVDQCRNGQQIEDVNADRESHEVGDQDQPPRCVGFVGLVFPFEHEPHHERREHRREGVDLALVGREPEGVGEGVGQRADGARTQYGPHVGVGQLAALRRVDAAAEVGDRPEHEQDAEGARQRVHGVDHQRHVLGRGCQHRGQTRHHHEQRGSGRMSHFELVGGGNELRAVPEACRRFHGGQVGQRRDGEDRPSHDVVPTVVTFHADRLRV